MVEEHIQIDLNYSVTYTRQTRATMKCWKCSATHGRVVTLACGHHFCISCLESQHTDLTKECKQPCQACFRLTVPKKTMIRNLTSSTNGGLAPLRAKSGHRLLTRGPTSMGALTSADDKLRPCAISWQATDAGMSDRLREKTVLTAIEAVQRSDNYFERANYVMEKFNADETGDWVCLALSADAVGKADLCSLAYNNNSILFRVGDCYFRVAQCSQ